VAVKSKFKLIGVTDENHGCACCGRVDLKRYAVIEDQSDENYGEISFYGTTCAQYVLKEKVSKNAQKVSGSKIKQRPSEKFEVILSSKNRLEVEAIRNHKAGYLQIFVTSHTESGSYTFPDHNSVMLRLKDWWLDTKAENIDRLEKLLQSA
jgi:hypothetical protein